MDDMINLKTLIAVFTTVFLAELGDKTQLATVLFAARSPDKLWLVFLAAASALLISTALAVVAGNAIDRMVDTQTLTRFAGAGFIIIGVWTIYSAQ